MPLLRMYARLHPRQYGLRGVQDAVRRVAELVAEGNTWAIETDIKDCYPSFDGKKVPGLLPLPERVTQNCMLCAPLNISLGPNSTFGPEDYVGEIKLTFSELFSAAQQGLPQGSATSPIAVEMLLSSVFNQLPASKLAVGYADNILALGKSYNDVVSITKTLWGALKAHPAGQLRPNPPKIFKPGQPIDFLGHRISVKGATTWIEPTPENFYKYRSYIKMGLRRIVTAQTKTARKRRASELKKFIRSWCGAFKLWDGAGDQKTNDLARIDSCLAKHK